MNGLLEFILELKRYLDPEQILLLSGKWALYVLILIIFSETGLMIGFFLPGDSLLFVTGLFCATGDIPHSIWVILACLITAAILGDQTGYLIGRKLGAKLFTREESMFFKPKYVKQTHEFYERHGGKAIILGRFVPIVRTFVPVIAGVAKLEYKTFVLYNITGGFAWILSMTLFGYLPVYFLGEKFGKDVIKPYIGFIALGIIIVSVIPIFTTYLKEKKLRKQQQQIDKNISKK